MTERQRAMQMRSLSRGTTMIEVLVAMIIIAFGLLGMAGLQMRLQSSEIDAYQRSQALLLVSDMANRIAVNRNNAASYVTGTSTPLGTSNNCSAIGTTTTALRDQTEWCYALQGAAETSGGSSVGAMIGGRGCVEQVAGDYMVTVAWQGMTPLDAPPSSVGCGASLYNAASGPCANDRCRRAITTVVRIATLS